MRRLYIVMFCFLGVLVVLYPVTVNGGSPLNGAWTFDVEATLALMREAGGLPAPPREVKARLARTRVSIDIMHKRVLVTEEGVARESRAIRAVSEAGGVLTLHHPQTDGQFRFLDDGRLLGLKNGTPAFVLRRSW